MFQGIAFQYDSPREAYGVNGKAVVAYFDMINATGGINGRKVNGARRDTVYVPPMSMVTVALDAGDAARWMVHCHHMPHLETGMMTEFQVTA